MKKNTENLNGRAGFTIIELVISIFIMSIAVVGIFNAFSITAVLTSEGADRLTATYLAQEGMEIITNIRDNNWLRMYNNSVASGTAGWIAWDNTLSPCEVANGGCQVDYTTTGYSTFVPDAYVPGDYLSTPLSNGVGFYGYLGGTPTKFERKITIACFPNGDCGSGDYIMKVVVKTAWDQKASIVNKAAKADSYFSGASVSNGVTVESTLYDWFNYTNQ